MKKFIFVLVIAAIGQQLSAQSEPLVSHYYANPILINPAMAGFDEEHQIRLNLRSQWSGFPGAPTTYALTYNGPISRTIGVGANISTENIGSITRYNIEGSYAFRYESEALKLSFGFATLFRRTTLSNAVFKNPLYDPGDQIIEEAVDGVSQFDASVGIFANFYDYYIGFSSLNLIGTRIEDIDGDADDNFFRHYQLVMGSAFNLPGVDVTIEPSLLLRKVKNVPFQADFNVLGKFLEEKLITGLSYRTGVEGSISLILGTKLNNLNKYYSYGVAFQDFQQYNDGSHEVTLGFDFASNQKWLLEDEE